MKPEEEFLGEDHCDFMFILVLAHVQEKQLQANEVQEPTEGTVLHLSHVTHSCKQQECKTFQQPFPAQSQALGTQYTQEVLPGKMITDATFVHNAKLTTIVAFCTDGASFISG